MVKEQSILVKFENSVRSFRREKEWTREDLAHKANLHRTYIVMIERTEKKITLLNIEKIASALGVTVKELFYGQV